MSIKVLVADDSITIQKVIGIIFGGDDYSLTIVDNGNSAVDKAREIIPDILLIDALMPGMTGYEVTEAIRSIPALASKPILILTGSFEPFDEERAKRCGANDFIAKPFESHQIINKVKELLENVKPDVLSESDSIVSSHIDASHEQASGSPVSSYDVQPTSEPINSSAPENIWGAFTPETVGESDAETTLLEEPSSVTTPIAGNFDVDVFAIVSEDSNTQLEKSSDTVEINSEESIEKDGPVEEQTFEFEEETVASSPSNDLLYQSEQPEEPSFEDIPFTSEVDNSKEAQILEAFSAPLPNYEATTPSFQPLPDSDQTFSSPIAPPAVDLGNLTEDQLRAIIAGASKEIIERIVWEIVPDLAETLILEAIRKIKQDV